MGLKKYLRKTMGGNTLFYRGCMVNAVHPQIGENYEDVLRRGGVKFIVLEAEICCGSPVKKAGEERDFQNTAERVWDLFKSRGVVRIITPCPACFHMFKSVYPKLLREWDIEVEHCTEVIVKLISSGKLKVEKGKETYVFHDPCHLGRSEGVYDEPREIVKAVGELEEFPDNRELSLCCGGGGGVAANCHKLAGKMAGKRAEQAKGKMMVTSCPMCYHMLKKKGKARELSELFKGNNQ